MGRGARGCWWWKVTESPGDTMSHPPPTPHPHCSSTFTRNVERNNLLLRLHFKRCISSCEPGELSAASTGKTGGQFRTREHIHMKCVPIVHSHQHTIGVYYPYKFTFPSTSRSSSISSVPTCYSCFPLRNSSIKLTLRSRVVTSCTTTLKLPHSVPTMHLCVLCESQSKW